MVDVFFSIAPYIDKAIMVVLIIFSILVLGISLERYFYIRPLYRKSVQTRRKLRALARQGSFEGIQEIAKDTSHPAGVAAIQGLSHIKKQGISGLLELFNATYLQEKPLLEGRTSVLATIGSNAPFVGLLGTVFGIMRSFHDLGAIQNASQQTVMVGISIALLATAIGLSVAIPSVMLYNYFRRRVNYILDTLENLRDACITYSQSNK